MDVEALPEAQPTQVVAPTFVWYVPAAQLEQLDGSDDPVTVEYKPAGQLEHDVWPVAD